MPRNLAPRKFFSQEEVQRIVLAIGTAESKSRGEIRVHVEPRCRMDPVVRASRVFEELGMTRTDVRAGILVYVATRDRLVAVVGDSGIDARVTPTFWGELAAGLERRFAGGQYADGVVEAVTRAGDVLAEHFPRDAAHADVDELPDQISFADPED